MYNGISAELIRKQQQQQQNPQRNQRIPEYIRFCTYQQASMSMRVSVRAWVCMHVSVRAQGDSFVYELANLLAYCVEISIDQMIKLLIQGRMN